MTHEALVQRAVRWLKGNRRCLLVISEPQGRGFHEWPDAIGWTYRGQSILIECKVSLQDFYRDKRKVRNNGGMGDLRFYLGPSGLLQPEQIREGWGLLECKSRNVRVLKDAPERNCDKRGETALLIQRVRFPGTGKQVTKP